MKTCNHTITYLCFVVIGISIQSSGTVFCAETTDRERIINIEELRTSLAEATSPLSKRINESNLGEKFDKINEVLQQPDIDKSQLLEVLEDLRQEINGFCQNWSELTDPLWRGQETVAKTIDKVRMLLARSSTGEPSGKVKKILENYDTRLSQLAASIKKEKNEERARRLKLVFANVYALRTLTERAGMIDLGPAQQAVYTKVIDSLSNLELALTSSTFQVERTRIVLAGQAEFIGNYVEILGGLIESEKLAGLLGDLNTAGDGISVLAGDLGDLSTKVQAFTSNMNALAERLTINIDHQTTPMIQIPEIEGLDMDLDEVIEQYSSDKEDLKGD